MRLTAGQRADGSIVQVFDAESAKGHPDLPAVVGTRPAPPAATGATAGHHHLGHGERQVPPRGRPLRNVRDGRKRRAVVAVLAVHHHAAGRVLQPRHRTQEG